MKNKNIFDDEDDIVPEIKISIPKKQEKVSNVKNKPSLLDDDDEDIFAPTKTTLTSNVTVQPKNVLNEIKIVKEEINKKTEITKTDVSKKDKPVFKYNSDDEIPW